MSIFLLLLLLLFYFKPGHLSVTFEVIAYSYRQNFVEVQENVAEKCPKKFGNLAYDNELGLVYELSFWELTFAKTKQHPRELLHFEAFLWLVPLTEMEVFWKCPNGFCLFVCFSPYEYQSVKKEVSFVEIYISACVFWMLGREYMNIKGYSDLATRKGRNIFLLKENVIKYVILTAFVITSHDILCWLGIIRLRNKKHILLFLWPVFSEGLLVYQFCHLCYIYVC